VVSSGQQLSLSCLPSKRKVKNKTDENLGNPNLWLSIDPNTVKQRIDRITARLEKVLQQYDAQAEAASRDKQKED
jgi:hypothetical protein